MQKIKVVKQQDIKDCGVCCLQSIIMYYGGYVPIEKLRLDTRTNNKGTNALNLIEASKKYGFDGMGVKVDSLHNDAIKLPAIAHTVQKNGLEHFVVIYKITTTKVYLMDPAKGKVVMAIDEFKSIWNNILLLFYPKHKIIFMPKQNNLLTVFLKLFSEEKKLVVRIVFVSICLTIFTIISSFYFKVAIDTIGSNKDTVLLKIIVLAFLVFMLLKLILAYTRKRLENHLNKNIDVLLLSDFLNHIFNLPLEIIVSRTSGEIMTRVNELMNIKNLFAEIIVACFLDFFLMLISIPILYNLNNNLFFILLFMIIIYLLVSLITSKIIYKRAYRNIELEAEFNSVLIENIKMYKSIKNLNQTSSMLKKQEKHLANYLLDGFNLMKIVNGEANIKEWVIELGLFAINSWGFYLILKNKLSITELVTFTTLMIYFLDPLRNLINMIPKYNFLKASFSKINEFLGIEKEKTGERQKLLNNDISISNLTYSYNNYNNIFKNFSANISSGNFVLLKGKSGSGKSTICKIIDKYITDYRGTISIGGVNIKDYSIATIRENVAYVSQNESLFTGTIKENILFGRIIEDKRFFDICSLCQIEDIVKKKPFRYDTLINDETSSLSGGERQRIILARTLMKDCPIYMLDEALSEVDYELERKIINNLKLYFKEKTIIYITHKNQDDLFNKIIMIGENYGL